MKKAYTEDEVKELIDRISFWVHDLKYSSLLNNEKVR